MIPLVGLQPFDPFDLAIIALLNPAVILVAVVMGRKADQWQKLFVAGFAAAMAGAVLIWIATFSQLLPARGVGGESGLFILSFVYGTVIATLVYLLWPGGQRNGGSR
jgi:hypothetical protein